MLLFWSVSLATGLLYLLLSIGSFRFASSLFPGRAPGTRAALFEIAETSVTRREHWLPRFATLVVPWLVFFCLLVVVTLGRGREVASNRVEVHDGPAKLAGMQSGDRVLSIDGQSTGDFDSIRQAVAASSETHRFVVERAGTRQEFDVVPDAQGRVLVRAMFDRRPLSLKAAIVEAWDVSTIMPRAAVGMLTGERHALLGPVAVVRSVEGSPSTNFHHWLILALGAIGGLGALAWLALLGIEQGSEVICRRRTKTWLASHPTYALHELHWRRLRDSLVWVGPWWLGLQLLDSLSVGGSGLSNGLSMIAKLLQIDWAIVMFLVASRVLQSKWSWLWGLLGALSPLNLAVATWLYFSSKKRCGRQPTPAQPKSLP